VDSRDGADKSGSETKSLLLTVTESGGEVQLIEQYVYVRTVM
jgi:hypothetical protein